MSEPLHILLLGQAAERFGELLKQCGETLDISESPDTEAGLTRLQYDERFEGAVVDPRDPALLARVDQLLLSERILNQLADGVVIVDLNLKILWANRTFEKWSHGSVRGRWFYEALRSTGAVEVDQCIVRTALVGQAAFTRFQTDDNRHFELHISPLRKADQPLSQLLVLCREITAEVQHQQRLDALHKAGSELAPTTSEQLASMTVLERIEILKHNIRNFFHEILHYDVIELRLLDRRTNRLEPLIAEGMAVEASDRRLLAEETGHGISGYVAATGKSYYCPDIVGDNRYVPGAPGARSSLTVPLIFQDEVIGILNVESPKLDGFSKEDVQFVELFSREIAAALHTLDLLTAEKKESTSVAIEAVNREVALPVDEILGAAAAVLDRYIGHDEDMAEKLRTIVSKARKIKQSIHKVGEKLTPALMTPEAKEPEEEPFQGLRVLVIDNEVRIRRTAHGILGRWGCVVETARDGQESLTMARLSTYDAILADIRLTDMSGYEAYRQLREAQPQARVILMTEYGYDPSHTLVKARQDGLKHILFKPFRVDQLRAALPRPGAEEDA